MTTKRALIKELAQRMECTDVAAKKFLNSYIELITEKLSEGEGVSIHYFGKLVPHYQTERPGRNLRTGEECKIRARTSVKFKASEILIQKLNPETIKQKECTEIRRTLFVLSFRDIYRCFLFTQ
ncbi:HU family DNA-binding protein [Parabacteroides merdae]|uniref:HU family DNA-binding protein n=1 Tax=Parabacteroides merdae TaxID=46503 RepID=UPI003561D2FB